MKKINDLFFRLAEVTLVIMLSAMVIMVFGNVVLRYAFNSGLTISEELSRWLFVWVTFLGAIVAMKEGAHLGSDTLVSRLSLAKQKVCYVIGHLLMLGICYLLFKGSYEQVIINLTTTSAVMEISMAMFYGCGLVLSVSGAVILINQLVRLARGQLSDGELIGIRESEEEPVDVPAPLK